MDIRFDATELTEADRARLNEPHPAVWCDRCQCVHQAVPAGSFDHAIAQSAQKIADWVDAEAVKKIYGEMK